MSHILLVGEKVKRGQLEIAKVLLDIGLELSVIETITCISENELMQLLKKREA